MNLDYIEHLKEITKKQAQVNRELTSAIKVLKNFNNEYNLIAMMQPPANSKANQYRAACKTEKKVA